MELRNPLGGKFDKVIADLVHDWGGEGDRALLVQEIIANAFRLLDEKIDRGELKIINTALKELRYAFKMFSPYENVRKVCVFGSARTKRTAPEFLMAREFARKIADEKFMVITGAASGIMEAANEGAGRKNSFGLNIRLPHEQEPNIFISRDEKLITFKYFFTRKLIFMKESNAIALFPGGFGTHDESFEALTLIQTGKAHFFPIVMLEHPSHPYWNAWLDFIRKDLLKPGYIKEEDLRFFKITTSVDEAVTEIKHFYSNYHSSRFVKDLFVMRVDRAPVALLKRLSAEFGDILRPKGEFEKIKATPDEHHEPEISHLPRIAFPFNRKSCARIRMLIDVVNEF